MRIRVTLVFLAFVSIHACPARGQAVAVTDEVAAQIEALRTGNVSAGARALRRLAQMGASAEPAIPALLEVLDKIEAQGQHIAAAQVLAGLGPNGKAALFQVLRTPGSPGLWAAARAVTQLGAESKDAIPLLIAVLSSQTASESPVREAASALLRIGPEGESALLQKWPELDAETRHRALHCGATGMLHPAILIEGLRDPDVRVRKTAAGWLGFYADGDPAGGGPESQPQAARVIAALALALQDQSEEVRREARESLASWGAAGREAILADLRSPDAGNRKEAAESLGRLLGDWRVALRQSLPGLLAAMQDDAIEVRRAAAKAIAGRLRWGLGAGPDEPTSGGRLISEMRASPGQGLQRKAVDYSKLSEDPWHRGRLVEPQPVPELKRLPDYLQAAVPRLVQALRDVDAGVRGAAAASLGSMRGAAGEAALRGLAEALADSDATVRRNAAWALGQAGRAAWPFLSGLVASALDRRPEVRRAALEALGRIGHMKRDGTGADATAAQLIIPTLVAALDDSDPLVRQAAAEALVRVAPAAVGVRRQIAEALRDSEVIVRDAAIWALGRMGPAARDTVPALLEALREPKPDVQWQVIAALREIVTAEAVDLLPHLVPALEDKEGVLRSAAAFALGRIGPSAKDAVPALVRTLRDGEEAVCRTAAQALREMGVEGQAALATAGAPCE